MQTWAIMLSFQFLFLIGTVALIFWFMFRKNDPLDAELTQGKQKSEE